MAEFLKAEEGGWLDIELYQKWSKISYSEKFQVKEIAGIFLASYLWLLTNDSKVYMQRPKTQKSQQNIEGNEQSWRIDTTQFQVLL